MSVYVDVSDFYRTRARSGIQRVVREVVGRLREDQGISHTVIMIKFDAENNAYREIPNEDVKKLFVGSLEGDNSDNYALVETTEIGEGDIFFDIDNAWNPQNKRPVLYKQLKQQNAQIYNVAYDMIPILMPQTIEANTLRNFISYVAAMFCYSDLIFCISRATEKDVVRLADKANVKRALNTSVIKLGADFGKAGAAKSNKKTSVRAGISGRFIMMVGTLEPRKRHDKLIDAFDILCKRHDDISLVIVGRAAWYSEKIVSKIEHHPLYGKRLFWLNDVMDDELEDLYEKAFMVAYLSSREGYGLPVAEGLAKGKITIAFRNSSHFEAGGNLADYARYETPTEVAEIIDSYLSNDSLRKKKLKYIKDNHNLVSWSQAYQRFQLVFHNTDRATKIRQRQIPEKLQIVFISNRADDVSGTIKQHDMRSDFVKEYIVVGPATMIKELSSVKTKYPIHVVDEKKLLGDKFVEFKTSEHVKKNWMLRSVLPNIDRLDDEFIMNDDDNRPLGKLSRDFFINADGTYNAYYFYELPHWVHRTSDYDRAQHISTEYLGRENLELLLYSAHQPQIINKQLFKEAVKLVEDRNMPLPVDEWSTYFNYSISRMPTLFRKKPFETMCWPANASDWFFQVPPPKFTIENFYQEMYEDGQPFEGLKIHGDSEKKKKIMTERKELFAQSQGQLDVALDISSKRDMAHGSIKYSTDDFDLYLSGIPYLLAAHDHTVVRIEANVKLVTKNKLKLRDFRIEAIDMLGRLVSGKTYKVTESKNGYHEADVSIPITVTKSGTRYVTFYTFVNGVPVKAQGINPKSALVTVSRDSQLTDLLK